MNIREFIKAGLNRDTEQQFFHFLFEQYYERVYKTILMITRDDEISKDMTQETFLKVFTNINQLREPGKFEAWLSVIATNQAKRGLSKKIRDKARDLPVNDVENLVSIGKPVWQKSFLPEQALEQKEVNQKVIEAIDQLNEIHKEIIILKYYWGLSEKEIAENLNIKEGTVKSRLHRARTQIRIMLEEYFSETGVGVKKVE